MPGANQVLDFERLAETIRSASPDVVFAVVLGSAVEGHLRPGSDLDLALLVTDSSRAWAVRSAVRQALEGLLPGVPVDLGILNDADLVDRFEAASGRLLFSRDLEA